MSRRYGRNQKRRHREEIAKWQHAYEMSDGLQRHISIELQGAKDTISEMLNIIENVSKFSVALPAKKIEGQGQRDRHQVEDPPKLDFSAVISDNFPLSAGFRSGELTFMLYGFF